MENSQKGIKKSNVYLIMAAVVLLVTVLYILIQYFGWANNPTGVLGRFDGRPPEFVRSIYGSGDDQLQKPMDVYSDGELVFVSDTGNYQVQVFNAEDGLPKLKFGKEGNGPGEFAFPYGITGDDEDNIYVADMKNNNISIFDKTGKFISYIEPTNGEEITSPTTIRIVDDQLYVPQVTGIVQVFDLTGEKLFEINYPAEDFEAPDSPNGLAVDTSGNIYVSDTGRSRVLVYDKSGEFKQEIDGSEGNNDKPLMINPRGIIVDTDQTVYVVDTMTHRIFGFDTKGKKVAEIGKMGEGADEFFLPNGMFLSKDGTIFVTDTTNQRIQVLN